MPLLPPLPVLLGSHSYTFTWASLLPGLADTSERIAPPALCTCLIILPFLDFGSRLRSLGVVQDRLNRLKDGSPGADEHVKRGRDPSSRPAQRLSLPETSNIRPSPPCRMKEPQNPETLTTPLPPSTESTLAELTRASNHLESTIAFLQHRPSPPAHHLKPTASTSLIDGLTATRHLLACLEDDAPAPDGDASRNASYPGGSARQWSPFFHARFEECIRVCDAISVRVGLGDARSDGMGTVKGVVGKLEEGLGVLVRAGNLYV